MEQVVRDKQGEESTSANERTAPTGPLIFRQLGRVMREIGVIEKTHTHQQGFKFRKTEELFNALHPLCAKHDVFFVPNTLSSKKTERPTRNGGIEYFVEVMMRFDASCALDGSVLSATTIGEGQDTRDKASAKAQTAAFKTAVEQLFLIPTAEAGEKKGRRDQDDDRRPPPPPRASNSTNRAATARAASTSQTKPGGSNSPPGSPPPAAWSNDGARDEAVLKFWTAVRSNGWTNEDVKAHLEKTYQGKQSPKELAPKQLHDFEQFVTWNTKGGTTAKGKPPPS